MIEPNEWTTTGHAGELAARTWPNPRPRWLAVLVHGYGDHAGRYQRFAAALVDAGAVVVGYDQLGHGKSAGERVLITDFEPLVDDLSTVISVAQQQNPGLPTVLIGHSLGGTVAARYVQRHADTLAAVVFSAPILGSWWALDLLDEDPIADTTIDSDALSRDPSVGQAYAADPLVWHGPFNRKTLAALDEFLRTINFDHPLGDELPALWLHGEDDDVVPVPDTRAGMDRIRGMKFEEIIYVGARHEVFHETNSDEVLLDLTVFINRVLG